MGHPLRSQHLSPTGPPRSRSASILDDASSHSGESVNSWDELYRNQALSNTGNEESEVLSGIGGSSDPWTSAASQPSEHHEIINSVDNEAHLDDCKVGGPSISEPEPRIELVEGNASKPNERTGSSVPLASPDSPERRKAEEGAASN